MSAEQDEQRSPRKPTLMERIQQKRHDRRKAKARRQFSQRFEDTPSDASRNAPRAALYTGSVGSKQRQAMDKQTTARDKKRSARTTFAEKAGDILHSPRTMAIGIVAVCLVAVCLFLYPTARDYYQTVRHNAQLEAEYTAIAERNAILQQEVDSLQSGEGVANRAHELYGWVASDENSVLVQGIERTSTNAKANGYQAAIAPDSVPAPETWYSPFLDWFFGYEG